MPEIPRAIRRRWKFFAATITMLVALYLIVVSPLAALFGRQSLRLDQARASLNRYATIAAKEPEVRKFAALANEVIPDSTFLEGGSDGARSASLQARLKEIGGRAGVRIQSVRSLEPFDDSGLRYLGAHLELSGTVSAVHAALAAIEENEQLLFVRNALLRMSAGALSTSTTQEPAIEAQIDVYGLVKENAGAP